MSTYVAIDLGAESGRVIAGTLDDGGRVRLDEVRRFANAPVRTPDGLHWDPYHLYAEALAGLQAAGQAYSGRIAGVGVDAWAVDYGLLDRGGRLLGAPYHYRDARTDGVREEVARVVPPGEQYARTGIAQLPFNTLYQVAAQRRAGDGALDLAHSLLMMPDLLHYWLCGERATEYTNASSTGMFGVDRAWAADMLAQLDLPSHILLPPRQPGTTLGPLRPAVRAECGLGAIPVILPATHDTASAVAAVPLGTSSSDRPGQEEGQGRAYISSGTWSLLGLELDHPVLGEEARLGGFTNEGGVGGTYRFLTNIMGLWLVQECRRSWARAGRDRGYDELTAAAAAAPSPGVVIDADGPTFLHPDDMPVAIANHLRRTGQAPEVAGDPITLVRALLEGLALAYRTALERAERLAGVRVDTIHVVGGGARNGLLCQLTADACRRPVLAGPTEATALGNVLAQALGAGELRNLAEIHAVVARSASPMEYAPRDADGVDWDARATHVHRMRAARTAAGTT